MSQTDSCEYNYESLYWTDYESFCWPEYNDYYTDQDWYDAETKIQSWHDYNEVPYEPARILFEKYAKNQIKISSRKIMILLRYERSRISTDSYLELLKLKNKSRKIKRTFALYVDNPEKVKEFIDTNNKYEYITNAVELAIKAINFENKFKEIVNDAILGKKVKGLKQEKYTLIRYQHKKNLIYPPMDGHIKNEEYIESCAYHIEKNDNFSDILQILSYNTWVAKMDYMKDEYSYSDPYKYLDPSEDEERYNRHRKNRNCWYNVGPIPKTYKRKVLKRHRIQPCILNRNTTKLIAMNKCYDMKNSYIHVPYIMFAYIF